MVRDLPIVPPLPIPITARLSRSPEGAATVVDGWLASFFFSYIIEKPGRPAGRRRGQGVIKAPRGQEINYLNANAYLGAPRI
jgi:hypothetical protein